MTEDAITLLRESYLHGLRPARANPLIRASAARLRAELAHRRDDDQLARSAAAEAESLLRQVGAKPRLATALLERARRQNDPTALAEARTIYAELAATRWLERVDQEFGVVA
jgi:hypothetical protein